VKVYEWKNVLWDHGPGSVRVLARSEKEARELALQEIGPYGPSADTVCEVTPTVYSKPVAFLNFGSA